MLMLTRTVVILFLSVCLLSGCLTARKLDRQIGKEYADRAGLVQIPQNTASIIIASPLIDQSGYFSASTTSTGKMLPLFFYWSWEYKNASKLNPRIPINLLAGQLKKSVPLKDKLAGRRLELTIEEVPADFAIIDKAHLIFFLYAFGWDKVTIQGEAANFSVQYKVYGADTALKSGKILIPAPSNMRGISMFTSWKTATSHFLQQYDANVIAMSRTLIADLLKEL